MKLDIFNEFVSLANDNGVLFYYSGEFTQSVIAAVSDTLRSRLEAEGVSGPARRKVFSSFMEMAQNILHYAAPNADSGAHMGALSVGRADDKFYVMCGNPIRLEHVQRLQEKIEPLRNMTLDEIKAAYREQLRNEEHEKDAISRGAGLGFLTVARESSEPLDYQIVMSSEQAKGYALFYLRAVI